MRPIPPQDSAPRSFPRFRPRPAYLALIVVLVTAAVGLSAAIGSDERSDARTAVDDPGVQAAARESIAAREQREAARGTPAARDERVRSRDRYAEAADADAYAIAREAFPEFLDRRAYVPFRLGAGEHVERYADGEQGAVIATGSGERAVVESTVPLRGATAAGDRAPVDVTLERRGERFEPQAAPVRAALPAELGDGIRLPYDGGTMTVRVDGAAADGTAHGDKLFYANAADDSDVIAAALPTGAELSSVLRSAASAETLAYTFDDVPAGAELRLDPEHRGAELVAGDRRLALIHPPIAIGADGFPVPVELAVSGRRLELTVAHRGDGVMHPVLVDPVIETFTWNGGTNNDYNGWTYTPLPGAGSPPHTVALTAGHSGSSGEGLYTITSGGVLHNHDQGMDRFTAPGDAYIYRADFNNVTHQAAAGAQMCVSYGVFNSAGNVADSPFYVNCNNFSNWSSGMCVSGTWPNCSQSAGAAGNDAELNYWAYGSPPFNRALRAGIKYQAGAVVYVNDRNKPTYAWANGNAPPTTWSDSTASHTLNVKDGGLGLSTASLSAGSWNGPNITTGCTGTRFDWVAVPPNPPKCDNADHGLTFSLGNVPEGMQTLQASTTDAVGNPGSFDYGLKVDRGTPNVTQSGYLPENDGATVDDPATPIDQGGQPYDLHVDATDASQSGARAGVRSIEIKVNGVRKDYIEQTCPAGSCPMQRDWVFTPSQYLDGQYTIDTVVRDWAGNTTTKTVTVYIDRTEPPADPLDTVPEPDALPTYVPGLMTCTTAAQPSNFQYFSLGTSFEGLPVTQRLRTCEQTNEDDGDVRINDVTFFYGDCTVEVSDSSCQIPLQIQSWPSCERSRADYEWGPDGETMPREDLTIRGTPAALFDNAERVELYSHKTTIVIFGRDPAQIRRAADAVRAEPLSQAPIVGPTVTNPGGNLTPPAPGSLEGTLACS